MVLTLAVFQEQSALLDIQKITSALGVILIFKEIALGLSAGLVLTIWFSAASLAGEKIASTSGLAFAAHRAVVLATMAGVEHRRLPQ